jgi:hypothetical protein
VFAIDIEGASTSLPGEGWDAYFSDGVITEETGERSRDGRVLCGGGGSVGSAEAPGVQGAHARAFRAVQLWHQHRLPSFCH